MRLKQWEVDALVAVLSARIGERAAQLYLFGSRAHDHLKGGDIDLLLLAPAAAVKSLREEKHFLLAEFKKEIGDQRIDLTLAEASKARRDPFIRHALDKAVLLKSWETIR